MSKDLMAQALGYLVYDEPLDAIQRVAIAKEIMLDELSTRYCVFVAECDILREDMSDLETLADWTDAFREGRTAVKAMVNAWREARAEREAEEVCCGAEW